MLVQSKMLPKLLAEYLSYCPDALNQIKTPWYSQLIKIITTSEITA